MVGLKSLHIDLIFSLFVFFKAEVCLEGVFVNLFYLNIREVLLKYSLVFYAIFPQISQIHCSTNYSFRHDIFTTLGISHFL